MNNNNLISKLERNENVFSPSVDIFEENGKINLVTDLPGIEKDNLEVSVENNTLTISAKMKEETFDDYELIYSEYKAINYERSFSLSDELNKDELQAIFKNGVLNISIAKKEKTPAKKIEVKLV